MRRVRVYDAGVVLSCSSPYVQCVVKFDSCIVRGRMRRENKKTANSIVGKYPIDPEC